MHARTGSVRAAVTDLARTVHETGPSVKAYLACVGTGLEPGVAALARGAQLADQVLAKMAIS